MHALVCESPHHLDYTEVPDPQCGPDDVVVRIKACGICGTDQHIYKAEFVADYPIIMGHEFSGVVAEVGKNVTRFKTSDRVTVEPNLHCGACHFCQTEKRNQCLNWQGIGVTRHGGFAEYTVAPEYAVFPLGDLSFEEGAFVEPVACCTWGLRNVPVRQGDEVLIFGSGPMGLMLLQLIHAGGASRVVIADPDAQRIALARQLGAQHTCVVNESSETEIRDMTTHGFDLVIDATGVPEVAERLIRYVKPRGILWFFGVCPKESDIRINPFTIFKDELRVIGTFATCATFDPAIRLLQGKKIQVMPLLTDVVKLSDLETVTGIMQGKQTGLKVQVQP